MGKMPPWRMLPSSGSKLGNPKILFITYIYMYNVKEFAFNKYIQLTKCE